MCIMYLGHVQSKPVVMSSIAATLTQTLYRLGIRDNTRLGCDCSISAILRLGVNRQLKHGWFRIKPLKSLQCCRIMIISVVTLSVISVLHSEGSFVTAGRWKRVEQEAEGIWCQRQTWGDGKQTLALSYQWLFECGIVPEAFLRRLCDTCALRSSPLTDAISHTGSENTRFQSHHCCEGNCLGLSHKSTPPCALQVKRYIYTLLQHTNTHTCTCTKLRWILLALFLEPKCSPTEFVTVLYFCLFFYFFNILVSMLLAAECTQTESTSCPPCSQSLPSSSGLYRLNNQHIRSQTIGWKLSMNHSAGIWV